MGDIRALIFDLDGLMADSEKLHLAGQNRLLARLCGDHTHMTHEQHLELVGVDDYETCRYLKNEFGLSQSVDELIPMRIEDVAAVIREQGVIKMPGLDSAIEYARRQNWAMAVASSSPKVLVDAMLQAMQLDGDVFRSVLAGDMLDKTKPHPAIYNKTAVILDVEPAECLVLEDSVAGLQAAVRAGMRCIVVPNEYTQNQRFCGAFRVANSLIDVVDQHFYL